MQLTEITDELSAAVSGLSFSSPVTPVYNPLDPAREPHHAYLRSCGPFGMLNPDEAGPA